MTRTYGTLSLTVTSPAQAFDEPLTLSEVKKFLNLPERSPTDAAEDAEINGFITGARKWAEVFQNADLVPKQWDLWLDFFPYEIMLRRPLVSVDLIQFTDYDGITTDVDLSKYIIDTARGLIVPKLGETWPISIPLPSSAVLVRHTAGIEAADAFWSDSGALVKVGMKQLISEWSTNRLPFSYDIASGGSASVDRIVSLLSMGANPRCQ